MPISLGFSDRQDNIFELIPRYIGIAVITEIFICGLISIEELKSPGKK